MFLIYSSYDENKLKLLKETYQDNIKQVVSISTFNGLTQMIIKHKLTCVPYYKEAKEVIDNPIIHKKSNIYRLDRKIEEVFIPKFNSIFYHYHAPSRVNQLGFALKDNNSVLFSSIPRLLNYSYKYKGLLYPLLPFWSLHNLAILVFSYEDVPKYNKISNYKLTRDYLRKYFKKIIEGIKIVDSLTFKSFQQITLRDNPFFPERLFQNFNKYKNYTIDTALFIHNQLSNYSEYFI
jgi:hypothetical protein